MIAKFGDKKRSKNITIVSEIGETVDTTVRAIDSRLTFSRDHIPFNTGTESTVFPGNKILTLASDGKMLEAEPLAKKIRNLAKEGSQFYEMAGKILETCLQQKQEQ